MKNYGFRTLAKAALALVACCALGSAQAAAPAERELFSEGLLWRITKKGSSAAPSYVFGTIHIADPRVAAIPGPVLAALKSCRSFAAEINTQAFAYGASNGSARGADGELLSDGKTLDRLLGEPAYAQVRELLRAQGVGDATTLRMKPWAAMLKIGRTAPRGDGASLDSNLLAAAERLRLKPIGLEWVEEQVAAFDGIPLDSQVNLLRHVAQDRQALEAFAEPAIQAWLARDLQALTEVGDQIGSKYPNVAYDYWQMTKQVVFNRSVVMNHRLTLPLRGGRVFVAVGALHLPGKRGLLALLQRDGYQLERIW